jgi:hypothetical protein
MWTGYGSNFRSPADFAFPRRITGAGAGAGSAFVIRVTRIERVPTRCLSFHAAYRCRHAGECCRAGWDVEVEPHILTAVGTGQLGAARATPLAFTTAADGGARVPARTAAGECTFHLDCRCSLQAAGGEAMLPSACRHFPRVYLRDGRGDLLTLSHFCPTAAGLLLDAAPVRIVPAEAPLALAEPIEGLDARGALPPLLRPGMLTDIAGYAAWEEAVLACLLAAEDADAAFAAITAATEALRPWTPGRGPLAAAVPQAFAGIRAGEAPSGPQPLSPAFALVRDLTGPHPLMDVPAEFETRWAAIRAGLDGRQQAVIGRYLAATVFGNWIAYRGQGLRSVVAWLRACYDVLRVQLARAQPLPGGAIALTALLEAIRMSDYINVHTVDSLAFGRAAAVFER